MLMCSASFAQFKAAPKVDDMKNFKGFTKAEYVGQWSQLTQNFVATTIYGDTVDLQNDYLNEGQYVVIDFSCTWCGPCWNLHNSGMLEMIDELEDFSVIWVEIEGSNTTAQIFGPQGGSTYSDLTYGNWTVTSTGDSIEYPIIDGYDGCPSMFGAQYEGYVPTLMVITPDGYFLNLSGYYSYQYPELSVQLIQAVAANAPMLGDTPACAIDGSENVLAEHTATFTALTSSADPITGISWTAESATPATGSGQTFSCTWSAEGTYNVYLTVTNQNGNAYDTLTVTVTELADGLLSYTYGSAYASGIGTGGNVYWAVMFPANMVTNSAVDHVDCYVDADYPSTYSCTLYQGGTSAPQTEITTVAKNVTAAMGDAYVTFDFNNVAITPGQNLWVVMNANASYPCAGAEGTADVNADWVSTDGSSWAHAVDYDLAYSWMIDCYTTGGGAGITRLTNAEVALYPNPTTSVVNVKADGLQQVEVLDVNGRSVMTVKANQIDMSSLSNGIYMFRVLTNNGVSMQKVVKK